MGHKTFGISMYIERPPLQFDVFRHPPEIDTIHTVHQHTGPFRHHMWQGYSCARVRVIFAVFSAELERRRGCISIFSLAAVLLSCRANIHRRRRRLIHDNTIFLPVAVRALPDRSTIDGGGPSGQNALLR